MPRGRSAAIDEMFTIAPPVAALDHRGDGVFGGEEHRLDVDPHHPLPPAPRLGDDRMGARDADVVVEDVDPPEPGERGLHHRRALVPRR